MSIPEVDTREFSFHRKRRRTGLRSRTAEPQAASDPGAASTRGLRIDLFTGTPARWAPGSEGSGSLITRALLDVVQVARAYAAQGEEEPEFVPDPVVHRTGSGQQVVHLYQHHLGIPVFEAVRTARFDRAGALLEVSGSHVPIPAALDVRPSVEAPEAVLAAARWLAEAAGAAPPAGASLRVTRTRPRMAAAFPLPSSPCVLRKRPFPGLIPAHLVLFYRGPDLRLAWFASLTFPADEGRCDVVVAANGADAGAVLYCRNTVATAAARGLVFHESPARGDRRTTELPPPLSAYPPLRPPGLPAGFPGGWVEGSQTRGNNADARRRNRALRGRNSQGVVVFDPADRLGDDQRVLNAFYFCNYLHDLFYLLGVDEAERNFQKVDRTGGGRGGDELAVGVFDVVRGFAKMEVELDGRSCRLSLGRGPSTDLGRHTALDADVVFHEYVHGVTARLVGGGQLWKPLFGPPQTRALDEGYCDYFALSIQAYNRLAAQGPSAEAPADGLDRIAFGAWTAGDDQHGLRPHAYGDAFPGSLATLGSPDFREAHEAGQVWCEALLRMNRRLGEALGDLRRGHEIGWQAVVDSLKLLSGGGAGIGFLAARDRILTAFDALRDASPLLASGGPLVDPARYPALRQAALRAFAELGMGPGAASEGATFAGIVADFGTG